MNPADASADPAGLVVPPVLVLSDLHLAHPATYITDSAMIAPLLDGVRTVVFNGDACELLSLKRRSEGRQKLARVAEVCLDRGVRPLFLTGNHDPNVSNLHELPLFGGTVMVTHGDVLHPWLAPWARDSVHLKRERQRLLAHRQPPDDWLATLELCKEIGAVASRYDAKSKKGILARAVMVGRFAVQPWRAVHALYYWSNVVHYAHGLQERFFPQAKFLIVGHTHRAGVWHLPTFTLVNTGSYQPMSKTLGVILNDGLLRVRRIEERNGEFHFGEEVHHALWD